MRTFTEYSLARYGEPLVVNLGCGRTYNQDWYGIDIQNLPEVDMVADLSQGIPLADRSVNIVIARDFLEHIPMGSPGIKMMEEIHRVMKKNGEFHFDVPSTDWNNTGAFQDPTHVSFWNEKKFWYFLDDEYGKGFRSLYDIKCWFKPIRLETYNNEWNVTYVRGVLQRTKD